MKILSGLNDRYGPFGVFFQATRPENSCGRGAVIDRIEARPVRERATPSRVTRHSVDPPLDCDAIAMASD
jgi:hypothetical protein